MRSLLGFLGIEVALVIEDEIVLSLYLYVHFKRLHPSHLIDFMYTRSIRKFLLVRINAFIR